MRLGLGLTAARRGPGIPPQLQGVALDLDFIARTHRVQDGAMYSNKNLTDIAAATRSSARWRYDASGLLVQDAANVFEAGYDPLTLEKLGVPIEEQRTNLCQQSVPGASGGGWALTGGSTVTLNAAPGPTGAMTMTKWQRTSTGSSTISRNPGNVGANGSFCASLYVRAGTSGGYAAMRIQGSYPTRADVNIDLATGATRIVAATNMTNVVVGSINCGGGLWRVWIAGTTDATGTISALFSGLDSPNAAVDYTVGQADCNCYFDGFQFEAGSFPTSYVPTAGAQVTRAADSVILSNIAPWFNPAEGTFFVEYALAQSTELQTILSWGSGTSGATNNYLLQEAGQIRAFVQGARVAAGGSPSTPGVHRTAIAFTDGSQNFATDGGAVQTGSVASMGSTSQVAIGSLGAASRFINGHIRALRYFPRRLTNAELQTLTAKGDPGYTLSFDFNLKTYFMGLA